MGSHRSVSPRGLAGHLAAHGRKCGSRRGLGAIPVVGDFFDFVWKANLRNVALLERHLAAPAQAGRADRAFVWLIISGVLVLALALVALGILLTRRVFHALHASP